MKNIIITIILTVIIFTNNHAQDAHSSQIYMDAMGLNPALTGAMKSKYRVVTFYRSQWSHVLKSSSYQTYGFAFDSKICPQMGSISYGYGFRAVHEEAGVSRPNNTDIINLKGLRTSNLTVNGSISLKLDAATSLSFGFAAGLINRYLDDDYLRFDEQFDGFGSYDATLYSYEEFDNYSITIPDFGAGIALTQNRDLGVDNRGVDNWMIGLGLSHIQSPDYSFQDSTIVSDTHVNMRVTPYAQTTFYLFRNYPTLLYTGISIQGKYLENIIGFEQLLANEYNGVQLGIAFRHGGSTNNERVPLLHPDALIATAKFRVDGRLLLGISYDFNISRLLLASSGRGGPEIVVEYRFGDVKESCVICPDFNTKHNNGFY